MIRLNPNHKNANSYGENQKFVNQSSSPHSATSSKHAEQDRIMANANRKLQNLEDEQMAYEQEIKEINALEEEHEYETRQNIYKLEDLRELWRNDPKQYKLNCEIQEHLADSQRERLYVREEREIEHKKMKRMWMEQEEEIYKMRRREMDSIGNDR